MAQPLKMIGHPLQRAPVVSQSTFAQTTTTYGARRMPIMSNTSKGLNGANVPTGVSTVAVKSPYHR